GPECERPEHLALQIDLQNTAGGGVRHVDNMVRAKSQTVRISKLPLPKKASVFVEDLDSRILPVAYIYQVVNNDDGMRQIELSRNVALHSPAHQWITVPIKFQNPRVPVSIGHVNIPIAIPGNIGWLIEVQHIVSGNAHASQRKQHLASRIKFE